jgi:hypothetical protein
MPKGNPCSRCTVIEARRLSANRVSDHSGLPSTPGFGNPELPIDQMCGEPTPPIGVDQTNHRSPTGLSRNRRRPKDVNGNVLHCAFNRNAVDADAPLGNALFDLLNRARQSCRAVLLYAVGVLKYKPPVESSGTSAGATPRHRRVHAAHPTFPDR